MGIEDLEFKSQRRKRKNSQRGPSLPLSFMITFLQKCNTMEFIICALCNTLYVIACGMF
jgi:hypothetical protein